MKKKKTKTANKKNLLSKVTLYIKGVRVEEIIYILLFITGILLLLGIIGKRDVLSVYFGRMIPAPIYYFDFVVRNGVLKWVYFALIIALAYWIAKKILKKKFTLPIKAVVIIVGLMLAFLIYLAPPYYIDDIKPLPGSFWPGPEENDINLTGKPWCGDQVDFIFSPSSQLGLKVIPVIEKIKEQGIPVSMYCLGDTWINDNRVCRNEYGLDPAEGEKRRDEFGIGEGGFSKEGIPAGPVLVIGCKYFISAKHNVTPTMEFICDKTDLC